MPLTSLDERATEAKAEIHIALVPIREREERVVEDWCRASETVQRLFGASCASAPVDAELIEGGVRDRVRPTASECFRQVIVGCNGVQTRAKEPASAQARFGAIVSAKEAQFLADVVVNSHTS